jgi:ATP adenylyltransferase/5',5'''-P-1,P-4-tetraphosphate phosphorylase II
VRCRAPPRNPFLPYEEALWVAHLSETHTLLLNKFNLLDHHTLVVTRCFESQDDFLNDRDLEATRTVMQVLDFCTSSANRALAMLLLSAISRQTRPQLGFGHPSRYTLTLSMS